MKRKNPSTWRNPLINTSKNPSNREDENLYTFQDLHDQMTLKSSRKWQNVDLHQKHWNSSTSNREGQSGHVHFLHTQQVGLEFLNSLYFTRFSVNKLISTLNKWLTAREIAHSPNKLTCLLILHKFCHYEFFHPVLSIISYDLSHYSEFLFIFFAIYFKQNLEKTL